MPESIRLTQLKSGQKAVISQLTVFDNMRRRLQDIGLIEGTIVECVGKSPLGDPTAFLIRGAVIALRSEDSDRVLITLLEEESLAGHGKRIMETEGDMVSAEINSFHYMGREEEISPSQRTRQSGEEDGLWD